MINQVDDRVRATFAKHLLPLAGGWKVRAASFEQGLSEAGWLRHLPRPTGDSDYDEAVTQEQERYGFELLKRRLGQGCYESNLLQEYDFLLKSRTLPSLKARDKLTEANSVYEWAEVKAKKTIEDSIYSEELSRFGPGFDTAEIKSGKDIELYIREQIALALPGFAFDRAMSTGRVVAITKMCHAPWKWVVQVDKGGTGHGTLCNIRKISNEQGVELETMDFRHTGFGISLMIANSMRWRTHGVQYIVVPPLINQYGFNIRYTSQTEMFVHLKYALVCYREDLARLEEPIRLAFEELEENGYSN